MPDPDEKQAFGNLVNPCGGDKTMVNRPRPPMFSAQTRRKRRPAGDRINFCRFRKHPRNHIGALTHRI
jgi:hypothetical protein